MRGPRFVQQRDDLTGKCLVTWMETKAFRTVRVYYQGWAQMYAEPMYSTDRANALLMSRGGARRAAARLRDPKKWGVAAEAIPA